MLKTLVICVFQEASVKYTIVFHLYVRLKKSKSFQLLYRSSILVSNLCKISWNGPFEIEEL